MPNFTFLEHLCYSFHDNHKFHDFLRQIQDTLTSQPDFTVRHGLIFYQQKIWIPLAHLFISLLLEEFHSTPLGNHLGVAKTLCRLQDKFFGLLKGELCTNSSHSVSYVHKQNIRPRSQLVYSNLFPL